MRTLCTVSMLTRETSESGCHRPVSVDGAKTVSCTCPVSQYNRHTRTIPSRTAPSYDARTHARTQPPVCRWRVRLSYKLSTLPSLCLIRRSADSFACCATVQDASRRSKYKFRRVPTPQFNDGNLADVNFHGRVNADGWTSLSVCYIR